VLYRGSVTVPRLQRCPSETETRNFLASRIFEPQIQVHRFIRPTYAKSVASAGTGKTEHGHRDMASDTDFAFVTGIQVHGVFPSAIRTSVAQFVLNDSQPFDFIEYPGDLDQCG